MNIEEAFSKSYKNKKVLITGLTGFKGSWMAVWLSALGAKIWGASLNYNIKPNLFSNLKIDNLQDDLRIDLTNLEKTKKLINKIKPDYIFHLAAQPLVLESIKNPIKTISSNTITSINILESLRLLNFKTSCIFVTTDKVYENMNINRGYNENDKIGGKDIYSSSKGMTEIAIHSYFYSFLSKKRNIRIATGRPCNCIGGGDWSPNRLIPDLVKSWSKKKVAVIRNPNSIRPWQHVLEPVGGYIYLCHKLSQNKELNGQTFNFGPNYSNNIKVLDVVKKISEEWSFNKYSIKQDRSNIEAPLLKININKSKKILNWKPIWDIDKTLDKTNDWYLNFYEKKNNLNDISKNQILEYQKECSNKWL